MRRVVAGLVAVVLVAGCGPRAHANPPGADYDFGYQALWPFPDLAAADRWLADPAATPWHGDPAATALTFTRDFLGLRDIDRTTGVRYRGDEAWVGVGIADPNGAPVTVATLHLVRFGPAADAPWEVVGSEDTGLTLDRPGYGSTVGSVIDAGGTISGVDESLQLQARQLSGLIGEFCCLSAGGERAPWSVRLPISGTQPGAITVVVWTGGHYANIERFAITGLRSG
jgi:hypothetical protein